MRVVGRARNNIERGSAGHHSVVKTGEPHEVHCSHDTDRLREGLDGYSWIFQRPALRGWERAVQSLGQLTVI